MKNISILDCTLRDGGYINDWEFGNKAIKDITYKISQTGIEFFEMGFMIDKPYNRDKSIFSSMSDLSELISPKKDNLQYVGMIKLGEFPIEKLSPKGSNSLDVLRIIFKKTELDKAYDYCEKVQNLGYTLFVQPVGTDNYSDEEFIAVIKKFNALYPHAFYIVDSFGVIDRKDFARLVYLADNNLANGVALGYHSHNNMQQAYGNAQFMAELNINRDIIMDSCIFGMGRGAGNLNTELFARYLNNSFGKTYRIEPMLEIIDDYLAKIFQENFWGYSLPFYLSASNNCHPNFANYFASKNTLTVKSINELLKSIPHYDKGNYSANFAEELYKNYQKNFINDKSSKASLKELLLNRNILLLAPGSSLEIYSDTINKFIKEKKPTIISVNSICPLYNSDFIFCANEKRFDKLSISNDEKLITTSNIKSDKADYIVNYSSLLCNETKISDNSTLMLINFLSDLGINKISLAGFDGYNIDLNVNYYDKYMITSDNAKEKVVLNSFIREHLRSISNSINLEFITPSQYNLEDTK